MLHRPPKSVIIRIKFINFIIYGEIFKSNNPLISSIILRILNSIRWLFQSGLNLCMQCPDYLSDYLHPFDIAQVVVKKKLFQTCAATEFKAIG